MPASGLGEFVFEMVGQFLVEIVYELVLKPIFWVSGFVFLFVFSFNQWRAASADQDALIAMQKWKPYLSENGRLIVSNDGLRLLGFLIDVVLVIAGLWYALSH